MSINYQQIFEIANKLLFRNEEMPLPPCEDKKTLANQFNSFFMTKIEKIMETLVLVPTNTHPSNPVYLESEIETTVILRKFMPITLDATKKLILSAAPKSCKLDPIPTSLLRNHIDVLAPVIQINYQHLYNKCYSTCKHERSSNQATSEKIKPGSTTS